MATPTIPDFPSRRATERKRAAHKRRYAAMTPEQRAQLAQRNAAHTAQLEAQRAERARIRASIR